MCMCSAAAAAPPAAAAQGQRRRPVQHASARAVRKQQLMARCAAAATAAPPPPAPRAETPSLALHPLLLERGCATSSLSRDKLSQQEQEMLIGMGAAIRALQQVRGKGCTPANVRSAVGSAHSMHACMPRCPSPWWQADIPVLTNTLHPLQDLPAILERQPELEHFAESVVFEDRLSPRLGLPAASCAGKEAYSRLCWSLRFHRTLFFSKAKVGGWVGGWVDGVLLFGVAPSASQPYPILFCSSFSHSCTHLSFPPPLLSPCPRWSCSACGSGSAA